MDKNQVYERRILISTWINPHFKWAICKAWWFFWKKLRHFRSCKSLKDRPDEFLEAFQETSFHFITTILLYYSPVILNEDLKDSKEYQGGTKWLKINFCIHIYYRYFKFIEPSAVTWGPPGVLRENPLKKSNFDTKKFHTHESAYHRVCFTASYVANTWSEYIQ